MLCCVFKLQLLSQISLEFKINNKIIYGNWYSYVRPGTQGSGKKPGQFCDQTLLKQKYIERRESGFTVPVQLQKCQIFRPDNLYFFLDYMYIVHKWRRTHQPAPSSRCSHLLKPRHKVSAAKCRVRVQSACSCSLCHLHINKYGLINL